MWSVWLSVADHLAVGGDILDMALSRANKNARFVMCGAISQYNSKDPKGPRVSHSPGRTMSIPLWR